MAKEIEISLDGPGVTPKTVDALALLRLADSYFRLLVKVSEANHLGLELRGLRVKDGSATIASNANSVDAARSAVRRTLRIVVEDESPPRGAEDVAKDVRTNVRALPPEHLALVLIGGMKRTIRVRERLLQEGPWERTELRAQPIRVGGDRPTVKLRSDSEVDSFVLDVEDKGHARLLGAALYLDMDVEIEICRDHEGRIERGRVLDVHRLDEQAEVESWKGWYNSNAKEWDGAADIERDLGRA